MQSAWGIEVIEKRPLKAKKAAIDQALARLRLLAERTHAITDALELAKAARRPHARDRGFLAVLLVKFQQRPQIHVRKSVSVRDHELPIMRFEVFGSPANPGAGHRLFAGVGQGDAPALGRRLDRRAIECRSAHRGAT